MPSSNFNLELYWGHIVLQSFYEILTFDESIKSGCVQTNGILLFSDILLSIPIYKAREETIFL